MSRDHYQVLGIARTADDKEIKTAYRKLAAEKHPDKFPDDPNAEQVFAEINEARRVLSDKELRAAYDAELSGGRSATAGGRGRTRPGPTAPGASPGNRPQPRTGRDGGMGGLDDMLGAMFTGGASAYRPRGAGGGTAGGASAKAPTAGTPAAPAAPAEDAFIEVTLEEAFNGAARLHRVEGRFPCPECRGSGKSAKTSGGLSVGFTACPTCSGKGSVRRAEDVPVNIPVGVYEGARLRVKGKGAADSRGQRGDLYLAVRFKKDDRYQVSGSDVTVETSIPYTIMVLGGEAEIDLPGVKQRVSIPAGTQSGERLKQPGKGLPALGARPAGDLYIKTKIAVPKNVTGDERKLLAQIARIRNEKVNA